MRSSKRSTHRQKKSIASRNLGYDQLEEKNLLATVVAYDAATQGLGISLNSTNDVAVVDIAANGNVTVNGNQDLSSAAGVQTASATALSSITITGNDGSNQQVALNGNFSAELGSSVDSVTVTDVRAIAVNGQYTLSGDLYVTLDQAGGQVGQGTASALTVFGTTTIDANSNPVRLDNASNDFIGTVSVSNTDGETKLADANDISLLNVTVGGDLNITADDIVDSTGSEISVEGITRFDATSVVLGDNAGDTVNFMAISSNTTEDFVLVEDSATVLLNVTARNLDVTSSGGIYDGRRTDILVTNQATFDAATQIRIGENGADTFNAGMLNVNAGTHVNISADSAVMFTGDNSASSLSVLTLDDIADTANATLNVSGITHFEGASVVVGDSTTDEFNAGSLQFVTWGDLNISENSDTHIIEGKNEARRLFLNSDGDITDDVNSQINVDLFSQFIAQTVIIGDSATDEFNTGSVGFRTSGNFNLTEDSRTNIIGANSANSSNIVSAGAITNNFVGANGEGTSIDVTYNAAFEGTSITLGEELNDSLNFGALQLNSPGVATVSEDSATHFTRSSEVSELNLTSMGGVTDAVSSSLTVTGTANIEGELVRLGENATDQVSAGLFMVNSDGFVEIIENEGENSLVIVTNGIVTDNQGNETGIEGFLSLTGGSSSLESEIAEFLELGQLQFDSNGNTSITIDSDFEVAEGEDGDPVTLVSNTSITNSETAEILAEGTVSITAIDLVIDELANDSFDILNGDANSLFVNFSGLIEIELNS